MNAWLGPDAGWPAGVRALTTLRAPLGVSAAPFDRLNLGVHCGDDPRAVAANRAALAAAAGLPAAPCWLRQVHGTVVRRFAAPDASEPEADAAVTAVRGVVLAILSADCLPVLLAADDGSEVAAAHAGWRGLAAGVIEATVRALRTPPARLHVWLGPAAGPGAYEVDAPVRDAFVTAAAEAEATFAPTRTGHWRCDLYALARQRLHALGVTRISGGAHCTISAPERFFSHRRDGHCGRMASLVWIQ